jgi:hypothetical protein
MSGPILATVVDWASLGKTALAALVAGTGITLAFSLAILGTARAADLRRDGRAAAAAIALALGLVALAVSLAGVTVGLLAVIND